MSAMDDALAFVQKDPVAGFVAIPIIGARPPKKAVIVKLKGRDLLLPDWTGKEWIWYADLASRFADTVDKNRAGKLDVEANVKRLAPLYIAMQSVGAGRPTPVAAAAFYDRCVRLVIAARHAGDSDAGPTFAAAFKDAFVNVPATIGEALAAVLSAGGDVIKPIIRESIKITGDVFEEVTGIGIGLIAIVALGLYLWTQSKHGKDG
jgi:uncharacterized protein YbjT (DUF2867 family)